MLRPLEQQALDSHSVLAHDAQRSGRAGANDELPAVVVAAEPDSAARVSKRGYRRGELGAVPHLNRADITVCGQGENEPDHGENSEYAQSRNLTPPLTRG